MAAAPGVVAPIEAARHLATRRWKRRLGNVNSLKIDKIALGAGWWTSTPTRAVALNCLSPVLR